MNVREIAYRVLRITEKKGFVPRNELDPALSRMESGDRAFLKELVWGVLRRRVYLDWVIDLHLKKPQIPPSIRVLLRMGAYQILFMDGIPDYAAVSETVSLVKEKSFRGLVNAILRNISRKRNFKPSDPCVEYSHPTWVCRELFDVFGEDGALRIMKSHLEPNPLVLRVNTLRVRREELVEELVAEGLNPEKTPHSPYGIVIDHNGPVGELRAVREGRATVQGEASQIVSVLLDPKPGESVLDACASPGGKTTHIAELMGDDGRVVAVDVSFDKVEKVVENAKRLGLKSVETAIADSRKVHEVFEGEFDRVLVDAPCTSLGTARKNPEVLHRVRRDDVEKLSKIQLGILDSTWRVLKKGGYLLYSVCTFTRNETSEVVSEFLKLHPDAETIDLEGFFERFGIDHAHDGVGFFMLPDKTLSEFYVSLIKKG